MFRMSKPTLYLFIGYPGAGKTSAAKAIADATGAVHLWADVERHKLFPNPTHSLQESNELYERLNQRASELLAQGKSVLYDTNFNFQADRQLMRDIANRHAAETLTLWITTPLEIARSRAVGEHRLRNYYSITMSNDQFDSIVSKLEAPTEDEKVIKIDGAKLDAEQLVRLVNQHLG